VIANIANPPATARRRQDKASPKLIEGTPVQSPGVIRRI